ncbi:MAG TPA: hypothetical protein PL131_00425 [Methylotenera sp.]|nr:hypothetical protein [Methylotenera sp.]HPH04310.1 hypothetical protein [Methylotenera sp.]HPM99864.1 hypothetical protein [Methylotenera sp.]
MKYILTLMVFILFALSRSTYAESDFATGNQALSSSASVHFVIKIPPTMFVRIGNTMPNSKMTAGEIQTPLSVRVLSNTGTILLSSSKSQYLEAANLKLIKNLDTSFNHQEATPITYTAAMP